MNRKNIILIAGMAVAIVIAAYLIYSYFGDVNGKKSGQTSSGSGNLNEDNGIFTKTPSSSDFSSGVVSDNMNFSDQTLTGRGIYDLISVLEKLNFGIEFFENEKFTKLIDFSKKVEVREEEKGNFNPFRAVGIVFVPSGVKNASSTTP